MIFVTIASALCIATAFALRSNVMANGTIAVSGFNGVGVLIGFAIYVVATAVLGPEFSIPLIATFMLHELGQVLAYRMLGYKRARFRLVPFLDSRSTADRLVVNDGDAFFVALLGPAFCLGPMALAMAIASAVAPVAPVTAQSIWVFAITCGAVNFISLMPFWPLAGGRCVRAATTTFWPTLAPALAAFMTAAMFTASLRTGSAVLMVMAGIGVHSLWRQHKSTGTTMPANAGLIALAAYTFTLAAHFSVGQILFDAYF